MPFFNLNKEIKRNFSKQNNINAISIQNETGTTRN